MAAAPAFGQLPASALPTAGTVSAGSATISQSAAAMRIDQHSAKAIIDWQSFNIGRDAAVHFQQPSASAIALNRVGADGGRSIIDGRLTANGQVWLLNPGGVLFGPTARVDVGSLLAGSLKLGNDDFLSGNYRFGKDGNGRIVNQGMLTAADGGYVALLAPEVRNEGVIAARLGTVALVSGDELRVDFSGDRLIEIKVDQASVNGLIENKNLVEADGGWVLMSAGAAGNLASGAINNTGIVRAVSLTNHQGRIRLEGRNTAVTGTLDVHSDTALGGRIEVMGDAVQVGEGAHLTASGWTGGGAVLVGGSWQNSDTSVPQATATYVARTAVLEANATKVGAGGTVVAWSDIHNPQSVTRAHGDFQARGGPNGGNGGRIETSGHTVDIAGIRINAGAPHGTGGLWLIDPYDYTIDSSAAGVISTALGNGTSVTVDTDADVAEYGSGGNSNYGGNISVASDILKAGGGDATLTLRAAADIDISGSSISSTPSSKLNVVLQSRSLGTGVGVVRIRNGSSITTYGGNILIGGGVDPSTGFAIGGDGGYDGGVDGITIIDSTLDSGAGSITLRGQGGNSAQEPGSGVRLSNALIQSSSGAIDIVGATNSTNNSLSYYGIWVSGASIRSTGNAPIKLTADTVEIDEGTQEVPVSGTIDAGSGRVTIAPLTAGRAIDLGGWDDPVGGIYEGKYYPPVLGLTNAELASITAGVLQIGNMTAGKITVLENIDYTGGNKQLSLVTGGDVWSYVDTSPNPSYTPALLNVTSLAIRAGGEIDLSGGPHLIGKLAASAGTGKSLSLDSASVNIGTVDGLNGVSASGDIALFAAGNMALNVDSGASLSTTTTLAVNLSPGYGASMNSGTVSANNLTVSAGGSLILAGATLTIGNSLSTPTFIQTGGTLNGAGSMTVSGSFSKSGGVIGLSGLLHITQVSGNLIFSNGQPLTLGLIRALAGNIDIEATGGLTTTALVKSDTGSVRLAAFSPLEIGSGGVQAATGISFQANTPGSGSTVTLNGPISTSGGTLNLSAYGNITQNANISAPSVGVSSTSGNIVIASNAVTHADSISYAAPAGYIAYNPANFSGAAPALSASTLLDATAEPPPKLLEEQQQDVSSSTEDLGNGGASMSNFPTMTAPATGAEPQPPPKLIVQAAKSLPTRAGVLSKAELKIMFEQLHEARTALFGDALALLALNPRAADVADCGSGGGDLCIAKPVVVAAQNTYTPVVKRKIALLIGNNAYRSPIPDLETAIGDVNAISEQLRDNLGYEVKVVENADRKGIVEALNELIRTSDRDDSVMVMYAGHGYLDQKTGAGYWIPTDAAATAPDNWISNDTIARALGNIPAKQVMLVSDSCYSGSLTKEGKQTETVGISREQTLTRRSVLALSSGGEEPVSDEGNDNHSIFAWNMIQSLKNMSAETAGKELHATIKDAVTKEFPQVPQYGTVLSAGHADGGEYLLTPTRRTK